MDEGGSGLTCCKILILRSCVVLDLSIWLHMHLAKPYEWNERQWNFFQEI
jgi:hypothetical protein